MVVERKLTHTDDTGSAHMVDVGGKRVTRRVAVARGRVTMLPATLKLIHSGEMPKGNVLEVARVAGITAAKRTCELVPLCHQINLDCVTVDFKQVDDSSLEITAEVAVHARTGAEMEALTAVAVAALTIYDMCKAVDREIEITGIHLVSKSGGKSGTYVKVSD